MILNDNVSCLHQEVLDACEALFYKLWVHQLQCQEEDCPIPPLEDILEVSLAGADQVEGEGEAGDIDPFQMFVQHLQERNEGERS